MKRLVPIALVALLVLLVTGCQRGERPIAEAQLREELESQVLDLILRERTSAPNELRRSVEAPGEAIPDDATFLVFGALKSKVSPDRLDLDAPLKVRWQWDNRLVEARDPIEAYERRNAGLEASRWIPQHYIEFAILSISPSGREATVYVGTPGRALSGSGDEVTFERGDDGQWRETKRRLVWVS